MADEYLTVAEGRDYCPKCADERALDAEFFLTEAEQ
jgi:hypothetical protein